MEVFVQGIFTVTIEIFAVVGNLLTYGIFFVSASGFVRVDAGAAGIVRDDDASTAVDAPLARETRGTKGKKFVKYPNFN